MGVRKHVNQLNFFEGIDPKTSEALVKCGKIMDVPKGTLLIRARESVDYIYFQFFPYVFNFADCCVVIGAVLFGVWYLFIKDKREQGEALKEEDDGTAES